MTGRPVPGHEDAPGAPPPPAPDRWTVLSMIRWGAEYLAGKGVDRPRLDVEHLLAHTLELKRLDLYLQYDRPLAPHELDAFRPLLKRRARREPLQYIVGHQPFRALDLEVDARVLVPRPETEVLVGEVLAWAEGCGRTDLEALDLGTGSGAIALSLALEGPFARVVATDLVPDALAVAERNRRRAGMDERVELRVGADFDPVGPDERFDVVVSNPPYVAETERSTLEPEVVAWEPETALFGGQDGLDVIRRIVAGAPARLREGGLLALEVGATQTGAVEGLLEAGGVWAGIETRADLAGRPRVVMARRTATRID